MLKARRLAWLLSLPAAAALAQEPPEHPALRCTLLAQAVADGAWRLQLRLENTGPDALELMPGAQLALYHDAAATDAWTDTARADRLQRSALRLAPGSTRAETLLVEPEAGRALRCGPSAAPAAALYFYRFNPRPLFRCRLQGWSAAPREGCPPG